MFSKITLEKIIYFVIMTALAILCSYLWINSTRFDSREISLKQNQDILEESVKSLQSLLTTKDTILNIQLNEINEKQKALSLALKEGRITKEQAATEIEKLNVQINDLKKQTFAKVVAKMQDFDSLLTEVKRKDSLLATAGLMDQSELDKLKTENQKLTKDVKNKKIVIDSLSVSAVYQNVLTALQMKMLNLNPVNAQNQKLDPSNGNNWNRLAITASYIETARTSRGIHNITYQYRSPEGRTQIISRTIDYRGGTANETVYIDKAPFSNGYHYVEVYDNGTRIGNVTLEK